ncbi:MAG: NAD-dependent epimerase/dehydratase family protein [Deltaproteobacteria bacterium]|nr:NAD-dependent epimerase/dehydratase family protein [Deltaproteobacteria bacterium]
MILVTGAKGQIGNDLVPALLERYGQNEVIPTGIRKPKVSQPYFHNFTLLDVTDKVAVSDFFDSYSITKVFHLAGILSARGEEDPSSCWQVNIDGLTNILDTAQEKGCKVFWPSSIAVFGPHTPKHNTPQETILDPTTMYGVTKVAGELLCRYYADHFGVDVRSLRFPGLISYRAHPGGGTTDYAVEIFYEALEKGFYQCFVKPTTCLPMMYMPDAIQSILNLMSAPPENIRVRTAYNITGTSFTASQLVAEIHKRLPSFKCSYVPDFREKIAASWPCEIDDSQARNDWSWRPQYELSAIVDDMLEKLGHKMTSSGGKNHAERS